MLGPALQQLFSELHQFDARHRSSFENQLHSELLLLKQGFEEIERMAQRVGGAELLHFRALTVGPLGAPSAPILNDLADNEVATWFSTKCSKADCPNKRIK